MGWRSTQEIALTDEIIALKKEIVSLQIEKARLEESNAKEQRELTHMIGLEKKRQEVELAHATQAATLAVREENLSADRERFKQDMAFREKRFTEEVGYLKDMMSQILERLPTVTVDGQVTERRK